MTIWWEKKDVNIWRVYQRHILLPAPGAPNITAPKSKMTKPAERTIKGVLKRDIFA